MRQSEVSLLSSGDRAAQTGEHQSVRGVRVGAAWVGRAQLLQLPVCVARPSEAQEELASQKACVGVARIDGQRGARLAERALVGVAAHQQAGQVDVRLGEILVERQRRAEVLLRSSQVAPPERDEPEAALRLGQVRVVLQRQREVSRRALQLTAPQSFDPRRLQRLGARVLQRRRGRATGANAHQ